MNVYTSWGQYGLDTNMQIVVLIISDEDLALKQWQVPLYLFFMVFDSIQMRIPMPTESSSFMILIQWGLRE